MNLDKVVRDDQKVEYEKVNVNIDVNKDWDTIIVKSQGNCKTREVIYKEIIYYRHHKKSIILNFRQ